MLILTSMLDTLKFNNRIEIEWGFFALLEFLIAENKNIPNCYNNALDIGSSHGNHTEIMRHFGLKVDQIDKYVESAEINADFNSYKFKKKYDVIFCSHVIEHQRNVGFFLDKIYDILSDNGILVISGPKHPAERFVEGHIQSTILPIFLQNLIFSGFDCKNGKILSLGGIENSFIVKKARNFNIKERLESTYKWSDKHQARSAFKLINNSKIKNICLFLENCDVWKIENLSSGELGIFPTEDCGLSLNLPKDYKYKEFLIDFVIDSQFYIFDQNKKRLNERKQRIVTFKV